MAVRKMVEVRRTVTVTQRIPFENYTKNHDKISGNGEQMTQDEIVLFENCADAGPNMKEQLAESIAEALAFVSQNEQNYSVRIIFYDNPVEIDSKEDSNNEEVVADPRDPKPHAR